MGDSQRVHDVCDISMNSCSIFLCVFFSDVIQAGIRHFVRRTTVKIEFYFRIYHKVIKIDKNDLNRIFTLLLHYIFGM